MPAANDFANFMNRMAPGVAGSSPQRVAVPTGAGTAVQLRTAVAGYHYFSIKVVGTGASVNVATGDANVAAPTAADPLFDPNDSWQDFVLPPNVTHIRLFGAGTGFVHFWDRGL